jgi:hypothetical protein
MSSHHETSYLMTELEYWMQMFPELDEDEILELFEAAELDEKGKDVLK